MESKSFNIVIYPPADISRKAINISKKLKKGGGLFILDHKNYFPHITLYMAEFPIKNVPKIKKLLNEFTTETKPFQINSLKYRQDKDGYIDINYSKSKNIDKLQKKIITILNPLRDGLIRPKDEARMNEYNKAQQCNIKRYGYRSIGVNFFPHLTLTKLEKFNKSIFTNIDKQNFSFKVDKIGFFYLDDYGTCHKLIEIFDFSK